jgi:hypothetical protein
MFASITDTVGSGPTLRPPGGQGPTPGPQILPLEEMEGLKSTAGAGRGVDASRVLRDLNVA